MDNDNKIERGKIFKELRTKRGLRQTTIARMLNISQQAYQKYEVGATEPTAESFVILANFYGVTTDFLLARERVVDTYTRQIEELSPENKKIAVSFLEMLHDIDEKQKEEKERNKKKIIKN